MDEITGEWLYNEYRAAAEEDTLAWAAISSFARGEWDSFARRLKQQVDDAVAALELDAREQADHEANRLAEFKAALVELVDEA